MFDPQLGVSLHTLSPDLNGTLMEQVAHSRIATLEVSARLFVAEQQNRATLPTLKALIRDRRIDVRTIHALFGREYDLSSLDAQMQQRAMAAVRADIELAVELDAPIVVVHASAEPIAPQERQDRLARVQTALAEIEGWCQQTGKQVAIELLSRTCLGNTLEELLILLEGRDKTVFGVCLDTNHLMDRYQTLAETVRDLGDRLLTLHLSDYDGIDEQHAPPGRGVLDWAAFMQALRDIDYSGPFNYECEMEGETPQARIASLEQNFDWLSTL